MSAALRQGDVFDGVNGAVADDGAVLDGAAAGQHHGAEIIAFRVAGNAAEVEHTVHDHSSQMSGQQSLPVWYVRRTAASGGVPGSQAKIS